jgi:hypothetical protein
VSARIDELANECLQKQEEKKANKRQEALTKQRDRSIVLQALQQSNSIDFLRVSNPTGILRTKSMPEPLASKHETHLDSELDMLIHLPIASTALPSCIVCHFLIAVSLG